MDEAELLWQLSWLARCFGTAGWKPCCSHSIKSLKFFVSNYSWKWLINQCSGLCAFWFYSAAGFHSGLVCSPKDLAWQYYNTDLCFSNLVGKEHGLVSTQQQEDFPVVATKLPEQFQLLIKMSEGCFQLRFCAYDFSSWDFFPCLFFFLLLANSKGCLSLSPFSILPVLLLFFLSLLSLFPPPPCMLVSSGLPCFWVIPLYMHYKQIAL